MSAAMLSTLPPLINSLRVATGGIDIVLHQMSPDEQLPAISEGRIDIGFVDLLGQAEPLACPRRFNIDHLCRLNFDQGLELSF